jgi:hypothetical protein
MIIIKPLFVLFFEIIKLFSIQNNQENEEMLKWRNISEQLLNIGDTIEVNNLHAASYFAYCSAILNGWENEKTQSYLEKAYHYIEKYSYGLEYEYDAFGDGTINSDTTNYTITITDHVGLVFLEGYKAGYIPKYQIDNLYSAITKIPYADSIRNGICFSYSDSPYDQIGCVHNVNISVAMFYTKLNQIKYNNKTFGHIIDSIIVREKNAYLKTEKNYYYWDGRNRLSDQNHLCFQAWCLMQIPDKSCNLIGKEIIDKVSYEREKNISSLIGHLRVLPYNEYNSDSLFYHLENIINKTDTIYYKQGNYSFSNPRVVSQLAVWAALFYKHKLNK